MVVPCGKCQCPDLAFLARQSHGGATYWGMFSTCIFCHASLGASPVIEPFPVGRRLAFDPARGRLWVVCMRCERWNLSPLDERWEAIEDCERKYRGTRLRMSTDNIGLARIADGMTLVRIGQPLRPEMAAWRYGDQFGRRRRFRVVQAGAGVTAVGATLAGGAAAGIGAGGVAVAITQWGRALLYGSPSAIVARIPIGNGIVAPVRRADLERLAVRGGTTASDWALCVRYASSHSSTPPVELEGEAAQRAAVMLLRVVNRFGGSRAQIADAVRVLEQAVTPLGVFALTVRQQDHALVLPLPVPVRLALEMAAHEERERRAFEGELAELEREWREAEEIAEIADNLLLPARVDDVIGGLRQRPEPTST